LNKDELMYNYLHGTEIYLYQRKDMFRVNSDTFLLGTFMNIKKDETVLDVGTNNGALLLYASRFTNKLIGVDVLEEAIFLAQVNLEHNKIAGYQLINSRVQDLNIEPVDVIVCNPPYFTCGDNMNFNKYLKVARHEVCLTLEELFDSINNLLKKTGRAYLVHRYTRIDDIVKVMNKRNLYLSRINKVYDTRIENYTSVLLEISFQESEVEVNTINYPMEEERDD